MDYLVTSMSNHRVYFSERSKPSPTVGKAPLSTTSSIDKVDKVDVIEKVTAPKTFTTRPVSPSQPYAAVTGAKDTASSESKSATNKSPKSLNVSYVMSTSYSVKLCKPNLSV